MKHLRTYENINRGFKVGDIVICINSELQKNLVEGEKYRILNIFTEDENDDEIPLNYYTPLEYDEVWVNVESIKNNQEVNDIYAHRFLNKHEYTISKYNL